MKIIYFFDGLGNQMFQYAYYKAIKSRENNIYGDLNSFRRDEKIHNGYELERIFKINIEEKFTIFNNFFSRARLKRINLFIKIIHKILRKLKLIIYIEDWNESIEERLNKKRVYFLTGWWQSEKFFKNIEDEIKKEFKFPEITDKNNRKIIEKIQNTNSIAVHVRRGDYLNDKGLGGLAPLEYYKRGIGYIENKIKNPVYFIFSNDIEWCRKELNLKENVYYIDWNKGKDSYKDMQLMSLCKHNIIPNSSFSWWGAWLNSNPNKIVVAPEKWFNDCTKMDYSNIVPESWVKMKNY